MAPRAHEDARRGRACLLLLVFFFVFLVIIIIVDEVAIFSSLAFVLLVLFFVRIIGDKVQVDGMRLRDLEFGFALGTTQDLAFFDFVFVDIDFGGTFRATDHGSTLRTVVYKVGERRPRHHCAAYYIPRRMKSTPVRGATALNAIASWAEGPFE